MKKEAFFLTRQEAEYCRRICRLTSRIMAETEMGRSIRLLSGRFDSETAGPAGSIASMTAPEKDLLNHTLRIYDLLSRDRDDNLKNKVHLEHTSLSRQEITETISENENYARIHGLDPFALHRRLSRKRNESSRKLYISDLHFFHNHLNTGMDHRGFSNEEEMNAFMIRRWNEHVTQKDEVYILGDFSTSTGKATSEVLRRLDGKKYLIEGNHDQFLRDRRFDPSLFMWVRPYAEIRDKGRKVILSHYPTFCYNGQYRTTPAGTPLTYMLYGHVHNTHDERLVNEFIRITRQTRITPMGASKEHTIPCSMINCFCMFSGYIPLSLDDWILVDETRRKTVLTAERPPLTARFPADPPEPVHSDGTAFET